MDDRGRESFGCSVQCVANGKIVNPLVFRVGRLKKQSQFIKGQNDVNSILIMVYGDLLALRRRKNKANSKPIKANFNNIQTNQKIAKGGYRELFGLRAVVKVESLDGFDILMENRPGFVGKNVKNE